MKYWALRWLSYPLVLGGASAAILWVVSHGLPYWCYARSKNEPFRAK